MKKCIHCGRELPDQAVFCPYCETKQTEMQPARTPRKWRKKAGLAAVLAVLILLACFAAHSLQKPRVYDAQGSELQYKDYHVMVRLNGFGDGPIEGEPLTEKTVRPNSQYALPARLFVLKNGDQENAQEEFWDLVDTVKLEAKPRDGASQMEVHEPVYSENFPNAAYTADVLYTTECGTNDLFWTVSMKNGDTLLLTHALTIYEQPVVNYYPSDAPMETIEELEALLKRIDDEVDPAAVVNIYLPPVVYEGGIQMTNRTYTLFGDSDGAVNTTFSGQVAIDSQQPFTSEIFGVNFEGDGSGIGLWASRGVICYDCIFSGWDTGALAREGSWVAVHNCTFADNRIGYQFNSHESTLRAPNFDGTRFVSNAIGLHLLAVPGDGPLQMQNCLFENNGTDIQNDCSIEVDLSEATMK